MPNVLTPESPSPPSPSDVPDIDQIQGDVLLGLQKLYERFVFFEITDVERFKARLRSAVAGRVITTRQVQLRAADLQEHKDSEGAGDPLPNVGLNFAVTRQGLDKLVPGAYLGDSSYAAGAKSRAAALNDEVDAGGQLKHWPRDFLDAAIDGVFIVTGGTEVSIQAEIDEVVGRLRDCMVVTYEEQGHVRPGDNKGHEHFGWLDGVSQPAIAGVTQAMPGQSSLDPGLFAFGYGVTAVPVQPWMRNGSFMVFRRLKQLVPEFDQAVEDEAKRLKMDPALLAARMVGRWKSGAPLALSPTDDDPALGRDPQRNNDFDFANDPEQRRCPFAAHIRKTNARADFPSPDGDQVDAHRILRAGIPFGPEVTPAERDAKKTKLERGLLFVCYQTSIERQFEFVQSRWANHPEFPSGKVRSDQTCFLVGVDPIVGQASSANRARSCDEPFPNFPRGEVRTSLQLTLDHVVPTAGAYLFVPSIEAIRTTLTAPRESAVGTTPTPQKGAGEAALGPSLRVSIWMQASVSGLAATSLNVLQGIANTLSPHKPAKNAKT